MARVLYKVFNLLRGLSLAVLWSTAAWGAAGAGVVKVKARHVARQYQADATVFPIALTNLRAGDAVPVQGLTISWKANAAAH